MTRTGSRGLLFAFLLIVVLTFLYMVVVLLTGSIPAASEFLGHSLGIVGFALMLMTETIYSIRKRRLSARWGRIASWLDFHIFTGLVGPYLVLLHSAWKFNGLAGLVMLLTGIVVFSGFIGRYIYTAVPRRADGAEMEITELERVARSTQSELSHFLQDQPGEIKELAERLIQRTNQEIDGKSPLLRFVDRWRFQTAWEREMHSLSKPLRRGLSRLRLLLDRRRQLNFQIKTLAAARRLLALWHLAHIPIGLTLFVSALIHIGAAIYYATLLR